MKFKLILVPFLFLCWACSKEDGLIDGNVLEEHYNTPIKNVSVFLTSVRKTGGLQQGEGSAISDNNGHYIVNFNYSSNKRYELQFTSPNNGGKIVDISSKKTTIDFIVPPISYLQFRLKNNRTNDIQLSISGKAAPLFHAYIVNFSLKAKADSLIPYPNIISVNGFGKTALSYSIISAQNPLQIVNDTISIFTKTDTIIHLIEIN